MTQNEIIQNGGMPFEEENSSFDLMEWVVRIIRHWYLFVIAAAIAMSLAYLKNKKVIERYLTTGTMIIKESSGGTGYGSASIMQGFGVGAGYTNVNNQLIILGSYDLIARTVDSLSYMNVEYITKGRFKTRNIYRNSPVTVEYSWLDPMAYYQLFKCEVQQDGSLRVTTYEEDDTFEYTVQYGEDLHTSLFKARIWPTDLMMAPGQHIYFRFRSRESLTDEFSSRLQLNFITERSTHPSHSASGCPREHPDLPR